MRHVVRAASWGRAELKLPHFSHLYSKIVDVLRRTCNNVYDNS